MKKGDKSDIVNREAKNLMAIVDPNVDSVVKQAAIKNLGSTLKAIADNFEKISPEVAASLSAFFLDPKKMEIIDDILKKLPKGTAKEIDGLINLVAKNCKEKVDYQPALEIARLSVESNMQVDLESIDPKTKFTKQEVKTKVDNKIKQLEGLMKKLENNSDIKNATKKEIGAIKEAIEKIKKTPNLYTYEHNRRNINTNLNQIYANIQRAAEKKYTPEVYALAIQNASNKSEIKQTFTKRDTRPQPKKYMLNALDHLKALKNQALAKAKEIVPPTRGRKG